MNFRHVWFIAAKNLRLFVTDRIAVIMFILFPFLFIVMFNLLLSNAGSGDERLTLHLATQETGGISSQIIQALAERDPNKLPPGEPVFVWDKDYTQAKADVIAGKISGFLGFPADFTANVELGKDTQLDIVVQPDATNVRMALRGLADSLVSRINAGRVELHAVIALMSQNGSSQAEIQMAVAKIVQRQSGGDSSQRLITSQVVSVGNIKPVSASSFVVPGFLVMFVFFASAIAAADIIQERRTHTLERLQASSVKTESILGGIYLGAVFRGLVQIIIFWMTGILVFHIDLGYSPWAVLTLSFLVVLMSAAFSAMLATIVKTERSASALAVLSTLILAALGGCWWPLFITPPWMQFMAKITPHGWANEGFNNLMVFGARGSDVVWQMAALAGFTAAFMIIAVLNFRTGAEAA
jgi:ABC-type multidrug transport system permease subunit